MKVACYARVSRDDLNCENQNLVLRNWCKNQGVTDAVFLQESISSRKTRPVKEQLLQDFRAGKFDVVVVARLDRWARSLQELVMNIHEIVNGGGRFVSVMNGFDFERQSFNASQQLLLNVIGAFAEFERALIRERTLEGLERARAEGRVGGRPRKKRNPVVKPGEVLPSIAVSS